MIAISLWQPWATALLLEFPDGIPIKPDETRHWNLPERCVGVPVAIHAAQRDDKVTRAAWLNMIDFHFEVFKAAGYDHWSDLPKGALVGQVSFRHAETSFDAKRRLIRGQHLLGDYGPERFAWPTLTRKRYAQPIPTIGRQGFFKVDYFLLL